MSARIAMIGAGGVAARHVRVLTGPGPGGRRRRPGARGRGRTGRGLRRHRVPGPWTRCWTPRRVDAAYVCVPPFAHGAPERAVLAAGAAAVRGEAAVGRPGHRPRAGPGVEAAGVVTGTGYHWRGLDTVDAARRLVADDPVRLAAGWWLDKVPPPAWWTARAHSGGQVVEQPTHVLDLARLLVGEVHEVLAPGRPHGRLPRRRGRRHRGPGPVRAPARSARSPPARCCRPAPGRAGDGLGLGAAAGALGDRAGGRTARRATGDPDPAGERARGGRPRLPGRGRRAAAGGRVPYPEALETHLLGLAIAESVRNGTPFVLGAVATPGGGPVTTRLVIPGPGRAELVDEPEVELGGRAVPDRHRVHRPVGRDRADLVQRHQPVPGPAVRRRARPVPADGEPASPYPVRAARLHGGRPGQREQRRPGCRSAPGSPRRTGTRTGYVADPRHRARRPAAARPRPGARHLRRPHGPDLRQRAAARGRRRRRRRRSGAGRRGRGPPRAGHRRRAWSACSPPCSPGRTARPRSWSPTPPRAPRTPPRPSAWTRCRRRRAAPARSRRAGATAPPTAAPTSSSSAGAGPPPWPLALRSLRPQGTVVDLAFYQGGADAVRLGEEFHHNGLAIRCAQIGRVPRGQAHLWDRAPALRRDGRAAAGIRPGDAASTSSPTWSRSTTRRPCWPTWPGAAATSSRRCSRPDRSRGRISGI